MASETRTEDRELVAGFLAGDERCFDALHKRYRQRVFAFALKRIGDASEAEDVTQEVFLEIFRCLASFEGRSSLLSWIFGIAHHQVCRRYRRRTPPMVSMDEPEAIELASGDVSTERKVEASRALARCERVLRDRVSEGQRKVFQLRYGENHSTRTIARRLGKSRQAVKISLFRTRRALSQHSGELQAVLSS